MSSAPEERLVIGVGHAERQDDGVGPSVARTLAARGLPAVAHEGDGTGLLDLWERRADCVVVDAVSGAGAAGRIQVFTDVEDPAFLRTAFVHSSHRLGVPEAIALARALGRLPDRLTVIGVTGGAFGFGTGLSAPVARAAERLVTQLSADGDGLLG